MFAVRQSGGSRNKMHGSFAALSDCLFLSRGLSESGLMEKRKTMNLFPAFP
jgi:hypothetical protein